VRKGCLGFLVALALVAGALWLGRDPVLAWVGRLVVEEGAPERADVVVVLGDRPVLGAAEAAPLVLAGTARRVLLFAGPASQEATVLARAGLAQPSPHALAVEVLRRRGVPADAIAVVPIRATGTNTETAALARWAESQRARRLIVITYRSHTRRVGALLRGRLGPEARVIMRAASWDPFRPDRWWHDRASARELALEGLRWVNSFALGDLWGEPEAGP
jgi:uncharacterized SAM-binding protein YcdF (DUF218 family)